MASTTRGDAVAPARACPPHTGRTGERREPARRPAGAGMTWRTRLRRDRTLLVMTVPVLVLLVVFTYIPMVGSVMAFQSYSVYTGFWHSGWVGLANFQQLLRRSTVLAGVREHPGDQRGPADPVLPRPDRAGAAAHSILSGQGAVGRPVHRVPAALLLLGAGHHDLPADARRRRRAQLAAAPARLRHVGHHDRPGHVQVPGHRAGGVEGGRLGHHRVPGRARRDRPAVCTRRPRPTAPAGGAACGTSPCPACAASSCSCSCCGWATR